MSSLFRSRLFLLGLFLRLALLPFFGSRYLTELFIPFLDGAVLHPLSNPWTTSPPHFFPYGTALFFLLFLPRLLGHALLGAAALGATPLGIALVKAPLLGLDVCLLWLLVRFSPRRTEQILIFYWLNPVLFFITYLHGQLDVAAMAFCVASLFTLLNGRLILSGVLLALATLCKFHVVVAAPFMMVYLWNRDFARPALSAIAKWAAAWGILSALGFIPLMAAHRFGYATAGSPEAFRIFAAQVDLGSGRILYVGVAVVLAILGRLCISTRISDEALVFGCGVLFGALVLVTSTMPGWYFWIYPFLALFYAGYVMIPRSLYWASTAFYLFYFALLPLWQDSASPPSPLIAGFAFTLLQTGVAGLVIALHVVAVRPEAPLSGRARPLLIGIAGDSGTGKNRLSMYLCDLFQTRNTALVEGDDYHRWQRGHQKWVDYTHLHPKANDLEGLALHTACLVSGKLVFQPHYDHSTGNFTPPREIRSNKAVIIQGLHTLYLRDMRDRLDLKVFLAPHELIRLYWKIQRDVKERGYSLERVLDSLAKREVDSREHIQPQQSLADWVIEYFPREPITREEVLAGKSPLLSVNHVLWNDEPISDLCQALNQQEGCQAQLSVVPGNINQVALRVDGEPSREAIAEMGARIFPNLRHITRGWAPPTWQAGYAGINQMIAVALLSRRV